MRRVSRCKPGDRNFGGVAIAARKRASGVGEEERSVVGESSPIADAFAAPPPRDHIREQKKDEEVRGGEVVVTPAVQYCLPASSSSDLSLAALPDDHQRQGRLWRSVAAFESCMLTMRTKRGMCLRPPEKGTGVCC